MTQVYPVGKVSSSGSTSKDCVAGSRVNHGPSFRGKDTHVHGSEMRLAWVRVLERAQLGCILQLEE